MVSQISNNGKYAIDYPTLSFHFNKSVSEIEVNLSTSTVPESRVKPNQTRKLTREEIGIFLINDDESFDNGREYTINSLAEHLRQGYAIVPSKLTGGRPESSQVVIIDVDDARPDTEISKTEYTAIYYPSQSFYSIVDGQRVRKASKTRQIIFLSRPIVFADEPLANGMTQKQLYQKIVSYIGEPLPKYPVGDPSTSKISVKFDIASKDIRHFYWGCAFPDELEIYPNAHVFDVNSFIAQLEIPIIAPTNGHNKAVKIPVKTHKKPPTAPATPVKSVEPVAVLESLVDDGDEEEDGEGEESTKKSSKKLTTDVLKYFKKEVWDKHCFTPDSTGKHICNGVRGWYDANQFYNLDAHNWVIEPSEADMYCNFRGRNFGYDRNTEGGGGWCYQKEDYLPPIYGSRAGEKEGKNILQYFKDFHPELERYSLKGKDYKFVVSFICNYFGVPAYPFDNRGWIAYDIYKYLGNSLRFNELTGDIEYQGKPVDEQFAYTFVVNKGFLPKQAPKEYVIECLITTAMRNSYHPIVEYLDSLESVRETSILDNLSTRFLGTSNPLYDEFIKKTLIAAVARQYNPGCQLDTCLVFRGKQGIKKSSFFESLTPDSRWFDRTFSLNTSSDSGNKDEKSKLRKKWIIEIQELDVAFGQKETAAYRTLFTTRTDSHRVPYGKAVKDYPRNSIFVSTVNAQSFLTDPEGNRRYWVIDILLTSEINTHELERYKDAIWAAAKTLYLKHCAWVESGEDASKSDYKWWFTLEENEAVNKNNRAFEKGDFYQEELLPTVSKYADVSVYEIAEKYCNVTKPLEDRKTVNGITKMLRDAGWEKRQVTSGVDKGKHRWHNPRPGDVLINPPDGF